MNTDFHVEPAEAIRTQFLVVQALLTGSIGGAVLDVWPQGVTPVLWSLHGFGTEICAQCRKAAGTTQTHFAGLLTGTRPDISCKQSLKASGVPERHSLTCSRIWRSLTTSSCCQACCVLCAVHVLGLEISTNV